MRRASRLTVGLALLLYAGHASAAVSSSGGLSYASSEGDYTFRLGGRLQWDMDSFDGVLNAAHDGERRFNSQLRRGRIELSGTLPNDFDWVFDVNFFDNGDTEIHAAGVGYSGWPVADLFVGRTQEPFGLDELTSSKAIATMRRTIFNDATDADSQAHYGVRLDGAAAGIGWSAGIFNPVGNPGRENGGDRLAFTGRVFGAPINDGTRVLHLGAAYSDRNLDAAETVHGFRLRVAESGERVPSATLLARDDRQTGLEALFLDGPFSVQAEYFHRDLPGAAGGPDGTVRSHYLQAAWTLSGESRGYRASRGVPGMIVPAGRRGAVELVARTEHLVFDIDGAGQEGADDQKARIFVAGANWYANDNVKLMFNLSHVDTSNLADSAQDDDGLALSARIQVAF